MTAYYNEIDPFAAAWLRELIKAGVIAPGFVDERSIEDVSPDDLRPYTQCHFFAGIGVWSYALRQAGWPDDRPVWTGSCPCQGFSAAGRQKGFEDERHLWPVWQKLIADCRPRVIFGEQVASNLIVGAASKERDAAGWHVEKIKDGSESTWFDLVQADLERTDYASAAFDIPAAGVGSPNIRQRLFFVGVDAGLANSFDERPQGRLSGRTDSQWEDQHGHVRCDSAISGLADLPSERCEQGRESDAEKKCNGVAGDGATDRMENSLSLGRDSRRIGNNKRNDGGELSSAIQNNRSKNPSPTNGFWADPDWLLCRDGKFRPVESGTFPLAYGVTNRVGKLRGYGNAINAEVAKTFIQAAMGFI